MAKKIEGRPYPQLGTPQLTNSNLPAHRALHMVAGLAAIAEYSQLEAHVSMLITHFAHGDPAPIAAIYGELRQGQIQAKALKAVAKVVLSESDHSLLTKVMVMIRAASDARDILAHRVWMYDEQLPTDVALVNPALFWLTNHQTKLAGGDGPVSMEAALGIQELMRRESQLWSLQELEAARVASVHAIVALQAFSLMHRSETGSAQRALEHQKVLDVIRMAST